MSRLSLIFLWLSGFVFGLGMPFGVSDLIRGLASLLAGAA